MCQTEQCLLTQVMLKRRLRLLLFKNHVFKTKKIATIIFSFLFRLFIFNFILVYIVKQSNQILNITRSEMCGLINKMLEFNSSRAPCERFMGRNRACLVGSLSTAFAAL